MVAIRSVDVIAAKWKNKAGASGADYEAGVRAPLKDWQRETEAGSGNYNTGVQQAIARGAFAGGVRKVGTKKWQEKSISKGPARYTGGVADAENDYRTGFGPIQAAISRVSLPTRGPAGDPRNLQRVNAIAAALRAVKTGGGGGTAPAAP